MLKNENKTCTNYTKKEVINLQKRRNYLDNLLKCETSLAKFCHKCYLKYKRGNVSEMLP
ncbi:hypothetical protein IMSAG025_00273 [Muribaculaceae bacterium]|nr:hypothetical protein IMSAG025_00273 [Muribaculaceae bacterium]